MREFLSKCEIYPDMPVGTLPLKIDVVVKCLRKPVEGLIPLLETHFTQINLFEYKSSHDIPKQQDLSKLIGYLGLYCDQHKIGIDQIPRDFTLWYISAKIPKFFDNLLQSDKIIKTTTKALYRLNLPFLCPYYLIALNELEIIEENLPLLLLTSGKTLKNTIKLIARRKMVLDSKLKKYLSLMYFYNYKEVEHMTEIKSLLPKSLQENIKLAMEEFGEEEVIKIIGIEKVEKILHKLKAKTK